MFSHIESFLLYDADGPFNPYLNAWSSFCDEDGNLIRYEPLNLAALGDGGSVLLKFKVVVKSVGEGSINANLDVVVEESTNGNLSVEDLFGPGQVCWGYSLNTSRQNVPDGASALSTNLLRTTWTPQHTGKYGRNRLTHKK